MQGRRKAREVALQVLYSLNFVNLDVEKALELFWGNFVAPKSAKEFASALVEGTWDHREELDGLIAGCSDNWSRTLNANVMPRIRSRRPRVKRCWIN